MSTPPPDRPDRPDTMTAAVLHAPGDLRLEQRPVPAPGPRQVLVQVTAVGVCGSDVHYFEHGRIGDFVVRQPLVLGHETSGVIVATGSEVPASRVGERVSLEPGEPDGTCVQCRAGRYNLCPGIQFHGTPPVDGTLAEYVAVGSDFANHVPDQISDTAAALLEPLSVGIWANGKAGVTEGGSLLIAGAGPIGLVMAQVARARGVARIVVSDINDIRLAVAADSGATETVQAGQEDLPVGFDAFIDCSGAPSAVAAGIRSVRPGGSVVLVGMGPDELTLPFSVVQSRELNVTGTFRYANTWPAAIALAATGQVDLDSLVTGEFSLAETEAALTSGKDSHAIKAVVRPGLDRAA